MAKGYGIVTLVFPVASSHKNVAESYFSGMRSSPSGILIRGICVVLMSFRNIRR